MAIYRQVHMKFWSDTYITSLSLEEKIVFVYLLTNEKTSACGIYEIELGRISFDLRFAPQTVKKILDKFIKDSKIVYSPATSEIAILNWRKYNYCRSPKLLTLINSQLGAIKNKELVAALVNGKPYESQLLTEEKQDNNATTPLINKPFSDFKKLYDRTTGDMKRAELLWNKLKDEERDAIMLHVPLLVAATQGDRKRFRPHPATYLNQRRWETEVVSDYTPPTKTASKHDASW